MKLRLAAIVTSALVVTSLAAAVTPTGAAPANTAPGAPAGLNVDDLTRPLNTDLTPRFGWLPQDSDANEVQSAYKIEVRDAAGEIVWDSRKVTSAQQSYVDYAGEKLEPGNRYTWRVKTWDRAKLPSRWSATAAFETGLRDTDWSGASWIRRPPGTAENPAQERDEWTLARTEVEVPDGRIVRARSYLAASHTAELYLGGEQADRMSNFGYPSEGYYQAADVTDLVTPGETLALGVKLHWFSGGQGRRGHSRRTPEARAHLRRR